MTSESWTPHDWATREVIAAGVLSGTSLDGFVLFAPTTPHTNSKHTNSNTQTHTQNPLDRIDVAICRICLTPPRCELLAYESRPFAQPLLDSLRRAAAGEARTGELCRANAEVGRAFGAAVGTPHTTDTKNKIAQTRSEAMLSQKRNTHTAHANAAAAQLIWRATMRLMCAAHTAKRCTTRSKTMVIPTLRFKLVIL